MDFLLALVPAPYRLLAIAALLVASIATGYIKGRVDEAAKLDRQSAAVQVAATRVQGKQEVAIAKTQAASSARTEQIKREVKIATETVDERKAPPAGDCPVPFAPERLRNIESAWGLPPGDRSSGDAGVVRKPEAPGERER